MAHILNGQDEIINKKSLTGPKSNELIRLAIIID